MAKKRTKKTSPTKSGQLSPPPRSLHGKPSRKIYTASTYCDPLICHLLSRPRRRSNPSSLSSIHHRQAFRRREHRRATYRTVVSTRTPRRARATTIRNKKQKKMRKFQETSLALSPLPPSLPSKNQIEAQPRFSFPFLCSATLPTPLYSEAGVEARASERARERERARAHGRGRGHRHVCLLLQASSTSLGKIKYDRYIL